VTKSVRVRWAEHVTYIGEMRRTHKILVRIPEVSNHLGDQGRNG